MCVLVETIGVRADLFFSTLVQEISAKNIVPFDKKNELTRIRSSANTSTNASC